MKAVFLFGVLAVCFLCAENKVERWEAGYLEAYEKYQIGSFVENLKLKNITGADKNLYSAEKPTLIAVFDVDCPMSLKLAPKLKRLEANYKNIEFRHLVVSRETTPEEVLKTFQKRGFQSELLFDTNDSTIAKNLAVRSTCEVYLVDRKGTLIYRGAIDDQYGIGFVKEKPQSLFLEDAFKALAKGEIPRHRLTSAPGCLLEFEPLTGNDTKITFHRDISRILQDKCQQCHHKGGVGPFELIKYSEVKERRKMIKYVVGKKIMPPWFVHGGGPWRDNYNLTDDMRKKILKWIDNGCAEGDAAEAPLPRKFPEKWLLEEPDLVVSIPQKFPIKAEGFMKYINTEVRVPTKEDKWISAIEIRTENRQVLHHVLVFQLPDGLTRREQRQRTSGIQGFFAGYVPGNPITTFPEGTGKILIAGTKLRFQLHYTPNGTAVNDKISIAFKFTDRIPDRKIETKSAFNTRFKIPPGDSNYVVKAQHRFSEEGYLVGFSPHMHLRGKAFKYELRTPDGKIQSLADIPAYDFNWQITYRYQQPLKIPAGSVLLATAAFDNSEDNPANPNPKTTVRFGEQTYEEMMIGYFEWYADRKTFEAGDLKSGLDTKVKELLTKLKNKEITPGGAKLALAAFLRNQVKAGRMSQGEALKSYKKIVSKYEK